MRTLIVVILVLFLLTCAKTPDESYTSSQPSSRTSSSSSTPSSIPNQGLTSSKVEAAVADLLRDWRMDGSVSVKGIQEIPQQNSAVADLQFNNFEYGVTFEGQLIKASNFKVPAKSGNPIPPPEEMFPPRKVTYAKDGKATLSKYNDGRWVLKAVNWGFDTGVKGNVAIR